jgi:hypothetical protein
MGDHAEVLSRTPFGLRSDRIGSIDSNPQTALVSPPRSCLERCESG